MSLLINAIVLKNMLVSKYSFSCPIYRRYMKIKCFATIHLAIEYV